MINGLDLAFEVDLTADEAPDLQICSGIPSWLFVGGGGGGVSLKG